MVSACLVVPLLWVFCVLLVQHPIGTDAVLAACVVLVVQAWRQVRLDKLRLARISDARTGESICGFARAFDLCSTDPLVVRAVYEVLQDTLQSQCRDFPVRASDRLEQELGIDVEDLDMFVAPAIAARTGRSLDGTWANPYFSRVATASDLVHFFAWQPERVSAG